MTSTGLLKAVHDDDDIEVKEQWLQSNIAAWTTKVRYFFFYMVTLVI